MYLPKENVLVIKILSFDTDQAKKNLRNNVGVQELACLSYTTGKIVDTPSRDSSASKWNRCAIYDQCSVTSPSSACIIDPTHAGSFPNYTQKH